MRNSAYMRFTYFGIVLSSVVSFLSKRLSAEESDSDSPLGLVVDRYLVLIYPIFPNAFTFAHPFDSEYTVISVPRTSLTIIDEFLELLLTHYKMRWNPGSAVLNGYASHQYAPDIGRASKQVNQINNLYRLIDSYSLVFDVPEYKK